MPLTTLLNFKILKIGKIIKQYRNTAVLTIPDMTDTQLQVHVPGGFTVTEWNDNKHYYYVSQQNLPTH